MRPKEPIRGMVETTIQHFTNLCRNVNFVPMHVTCHDLCPTSSESKVTHTEICVINCPNFYVIFTSSEYAQTQIVEGGIGNKHLTCSFHIPFTIRIKGINLYRLLFSSKARTYD